MIADVYLLIHTSPPFTWSSCHSHFQTIDGLHNRCPTNLPHLCFQYSSQVVFLLGFIRLPTGQLNAAAKPG